MAFWSETTLDPKRQFKFKVSFTLLGQQDSQFIAQSAQRPQYTIGDTTKVDFLDKQFHFPGKITWNTVDIKFVDAEGAPNASRASYAYLINAGWVNPQFTGGQNPDFSTISKRAAVANGGVVTVNVLNSLGAVLDKWTLRNAFITKVALNDLDYTQEGILTATYTFRYDWADYSQNE